MSRQFQLNTKTTRRFQNLRKADTDFSRTVLAKEEYNRYTYFHAQVTGSGFGIYCEKSIEDVREYFRFIYKMELDQIGVCPLEIDDKGYVSLFVEDKSTGCNIVYVSDLKCDVKCVIYNTPTYKGTYRTTDFNYDKYLLEFGKAQGRSEVDLAA